MTEFKGTTTGPWETAKNIKYLVTAPFTSICTTAKWKDSTNSLTDTENVANAHLIAASPDLLKACQSFIELFKESDMRPEDECRELFSEIKDAVDKALIY